MKQKEDRDLQEEFDRLCAGFSNQEKEQIRQFRAAVAKMSLDEAEVILKKLDRESENASDDRKGFIKALKYLLKERIQRDGDN